MQKVIVIGNLGKDPELRHTQNGKKVCRFSVATTERWGSGDNKGEHTEWFNVVVWERQAEVCAQYLSKGKKVCVVGTLRTRSYDDNGVTKYFTDLVAREIEFLSPKEQSSGSGGGSQAGAPPLPPDDDIPF